MFRPCRAEISSCGWTADTYVPHSSTEYTDGIPVLSGFLPNLQRMASVPPRHQDYHIPSALLFLIPVHFSESLPRFLPLKLSRGHLLPTSYFQRSPYAESVLFFLKIQGSSNSFPECKTSEPARRQKQYFLSCFPFLFSVFYFLLYLFRFFR